MLLLVVNFAPAIRVKRAVMSAASPGGWNGVYPAVNSNVRTPSAQQSTDLARSEGTAGIAICCVFPGITRLALLSSAEGAGGTGEKL